MHASRETLIELGLPGSDEYLPSKKRVPNGAEYRLETPSVEGQKAFEAVIETAEKYDINIHRISQGSGVMLLTDEEIRAMADLGRQE